MKLPFSIFTAVSTLLLSQAAVAQSTFDNWESFRKDGKCWASTAPKSSNGTIKGRSNPYLAVLNQPGEGVKGSVSVVGGYDRVGESDVSLAVDGKVFDVLPFGNAVFTASGKPEASLIAAMRQGRELEVKWTDADGAVATDVYSLKGFSDAKSAIDAGCRE